MGFELFLVTSTVGLVAVIGIGLRPIMQELRRAGKEQDQHG